MIDNYNESAEHEKLTFEIGFFLKSRFSSKYPDLLYKPSFVKYEDDDDYDLVPVQICLDNFDELIKYYENLFILIDKYEERYTKQHLWLRPGIFLKNELLFGFPWYDRLADTEQLYEALIEKNEGTLFAAGDQGWYFEIFQKDDRLLFYETSEEDEMDFIMDDFDKRLFSQNKKYHFDFDELGLVEYTWTWENKNIFLNEVRQKIEISKKVIEKLVSHFKVDFWSHY